MRRSGHDYIGPWLYRAITMHTMRHGRFSMRRSAAAPSDSVCMARPRCRFRWTWHPPLGVDHQPSRMEAVISFATYHDANACLSLRGKIVAHLELERLFNVRHFLPSRLPVPTFPDAKTAHQFMHWCNQSGTKSKNCGDFVLQFEQALSSINVFKMLPPS